MQITTLNKKFFKENNISRSSAMKSTRVTGALGTKFSLSSRHQCATPDMFSGKTLDMPAQMQTLEVRAPAALEVPQKAHKRRDSFLEKASGGARAKHDRVINVDLGGLRQTTKIDNFASAREAQVAVELPPHKFAETQTLKNFTKNARASEMQELNRTCTM